MPRPSLIGASVLLCALHLAWPAAQAQSQTRGAPATLAPVERFEVVGNTLLPQATIDTRLAAFKGATTLVRLREAAAAVQDLYRDAGYGGVIAFLPEQQTAPANPSRLAVFSAAYRVPLYAQASALDAYAAWSDVDGGRSSTAAGDLLFSGKGRIAGLRATRYLPRVGNVDQRASLGVEQREFINQCSIEGLPPGACGPAGASVTVRPLALGYTAQAEGDTRFGLNVSAHANLQAGGSHAGAADFTAVRQGSRPDYRLLRANGFVARSLSDWGVLGLRMSGQTTDQPLVPGEQFGIGGSLSVRGYLEREVLGDTGLQASLELSSTNLSPRISEALSRTELVVVGFADAAMVRNQQSDPCLIGRSSCTLAGAGVGLRATWSAGDQILRFRLDLAQALKDAYRTRSGDWRLHGSLSITF